MSGDVGRPRDPLEIRPARPDELLWLQELEAAAGLRFEAVGLAHVAASPPTELAELRSACDDGLLFVAAAPALRAVGFARAVRLAASLHLAEVSVLPSHGRRGVGSALVREVARAGEAIAAAALTLSTFSDVPWNAPFYEKLGFRRLREQELTPELVEIRRREAVSGLPIERRVIMGLKLAAGRARRPGRPGD